MQNKQVKSFIENQQHISTEESWNEFTQLSVSEQKELFSEILEIARSPKYTNKAIVQPNAASVIKRKLKPGVKFDEWYEGWLPPVEPQKIGNDEVYDYFPVPTRVINLRSAVDDSAFLTIGFVYNPFDNLEDLLNARPKEIKNTEANRKQLNDDLLEYSENTFYAVSSDDVFGL